jgi:hypothetical protein
MSGMVSAARAPLRPKQQLERAQLGALGQMKCLAKAEQALADSQIAVFGGWNDSFDSDITLKQPNGTDMTLHDVP